MKEKTRKSTKRMAKVLQTTEVRSFQNLTGRKPERELRRNDGRIFLTLEGL